MNFLWLRMVIVTMAKKGDIKKMLVNSNLRKWKDRRKENRQDIMIVGQRRWIGQSESNGGEQGQDFVKETLALNAFVANQHSLYC